jgi:hypothetical protein
MSIFPTKPESSPTHWDNYSVPRHINDADDFPTRLMADCRIVRSDQTRLGVPTLYRALAYIIELEARLKKLEDMNAR